MRDLSLILTKPEGRKEAELYVDNDTDTDSILVQGIDRELKRGEERWTGHVFIVVPFVSVKDVENTRFRLEGLLPSRRSDLLHFYFHNLASLAYSLLYV